MSDPNDEARRSLEAANAQLAAAQKLAKTLLWVLLWLVVATTVFWSLPMIFTGIGQIVSGIVGIISLL